MTNGHHFNIFSSYLLIQRTLREILHRLHTAGTRVYIILSRTFQCPEIHYKLAQPGIQIYSPGTF